MQTKGIKPAVILGALAGVLAGPGTVIPKPVRGQNPEAGYGLVELLVILVVVVVVLAVVLLKLVAAL